MSLLLAPIRLADQWLFGKKLRETRLDPAPVMVLGHWRSGTTLLQTLLSKDPQFGYLSGYQAFMPGIELIHLKPIYELIRRAIPRKRRMDNMPRGLTVPEEEEFALTATSLTGSYHSLWFPKDESYFEKFVLFENCSPREREQWKSEYVRLLKRIALATGRTKLMLKNPPNTARIGILLEVLPESKFVHIQRNPYDVFLSMRNMYEKSIRPLFLEPMSDEEIEEKIFLWYEKLNRAYLRQRTLIADENFYNVRYEDLEKSPIVVLKSIYQKFGYDFESARPHVESYLESVRNYEKNQFSLSPEIIEKINHRWSFAFEAFGYTPLDPHQPNRSF